MPARFILLSFLLIRLMIYKVCFPSQLRTAELTSEIADRLGKDDRLDGEVSQDIKCKKTKWRSKSTYQTSTNHPKWLPNRMFESPVSGSLKLSLGGLTSLRGSGDGGPRRRVIP